MKDAFIGLDGKLMKHEIEERGDGEFVEKMGRGKKTAIAVLLLAMIGGGIKAYFSSQPAQPRTEYRENQGYQTGQEYSAKK